jgi:hypothetical protein
VNAARRRRTQRYGDDRRRPPLRAPRRRTVYEGRIVTLRIERYRYPDG